MDIKRRKNDYNQIKGMACNGCVMGVTKALDEIDGIKDVKVDL